MTTGRINQVAAFLAHQGLLGTQGTSREISPSATEANAGAGFNKGQHCHAERPTVSGVASNTQLQKAPFPRILSENSSSALQRFGDDQNEASNATLDWDSRRGGCAASRSMPLKEPAHERELRTCTDCSGNGFGDKFAHRVEIQTPQPRLHTGLQEAQWQPSANWARTRLAGFDTHLG